MNQFYTLEGYGKNKISKKKINPDSSPKYYNDHELGSWLSAALKLPKLNLPNLNFGNLLPSLPSLPNLPNLSFPVTLPNFPQDIFVPPTINIPNAVISTPTISIPTPTFKADVPKLSIPEVKFSPVNVSVNIPKIDAKIPPANEWKADPKDVRAVSEVVKVVGDVTQIAGGVLTATGILAEVGVPLFAAGTGISKVGETGIKAAELIEKANKIKSGGIVAGLTEVSKISSDLGYNKVSSVTSQASNVVTQGQQISNSFSSGNYGQALNTSSSFLNSVGVAPAVGNNISKVGSYIDQSINNINSNTAILDQLKAKPLSNNRLFDYNKPSNTTNKPTIDIFKDPINDPSHPLYVPPLPSEGKTNVNPSNLPSNSKPTETQKKDSNNMIFLIAGAIGIFILSNKKGKK